MVNWKPRTESAATSAEMKSFIIDCIKAIMADQEVTPYHLYKAGLLSDHSRKNFETLLETGNLRTDTLWDLVGFLKIELLQAGILLERVRTTGSKEGTNPALLAGIITALDLEIGRREHLELDVLSSPNCHAIAVMVADTLDKHRARIEALRDDTFSLLDFKSAASN